MFGAGVPWPGDLRTLAAPEQSREEQPLPPALCGMRTGGRRGPEERGMAQPLLLPAGSSIPCGLWGSHAPLLDRACLEHGPLVFAPSQRQFQLSAALSTHPAQHSWLSPPSPRRSPVTGQRAKSLFAKQPERIHFLLALPLRTRLRAYSHGDLWGD